MGEIDRRTKRIVMKRKIIFYAALLSAMITFSREAPGQTNIPGRTRTWVNDYAGIIDKGTEDYLERFLSSIPQKTSDPVEVIIATFDDTGGWTMQEFARRYGEHWRLTKKGRDNGVVIIVFTKEAQMPIGVGRNMRGILTTEFIRDMMNTTVVPILNKEGYSAAVKKAAEIIVDKINKSDIPKDKNNSLLPIIILVSVLVLTLVLISNVRMSKR